MQRVSHAEGGTTAQAGSGEHGACVHGGGGREGTAELARAEWGKVTIGPLRS